MIENKHTNNWQLTVDHYVTVAKKNLLAVGLGAGALLGIAGGLYAYHHFSIKNEQAAHTILSDCLAQAEQAKQGKAQWEDVATMCQTGYEKFSSTKVAPYILAVEVDALLEVHKQQEALDKLEKMLAHIGSSSPLYPLYKMKYSLARIDTADAALQEAGFADLEQLANDTKNIYNDAAQYYLGLYYRAKGDTQRASDIWKQLISLNDALADAQARSPWAALAQEKMNGLA